MEGKTNFQMLTTFSLAKLKCVAGASSLCIMPEAGIWKHKIQAVWMLALTIFWTLSEFVGFEDFFWCENVLCHGGTRTFFLVVLHNQVWDTFHVFLKSVLAYSRQCPAEVVVEGVPLAFRKKTLIKLPGLVCLSALQRSRMRRKKTDTLL